jgi:hypothetical protein
MTSIGDGHREVVYCLHHGQWVVAVVVSSWSNCVVNIERAVPWESDRARKWQAFTRFM